MASTSPKSLKNLVVLGKDPNNRTYDNYVKILEELEALDPSLNTEDLAQTLVLRVYYSKGELQSPFLNVPGFQYPEGDFQVNRKLRLVIIEQGESLRENWKVIRGPKNGELNVAHSLARLDCNIRSGVTKALLYSWIADLGKIPFKHLPDWLGKGKDFFTGKKIRKSDNVGTLSREDISGDIFGDKLYEAFLRFRRFQRAPKLSDVAYRAKLDTTRQRVLRNSPTVKQNQPNNLNTGKTGNRNPRMPRRNFLASGQNNTKVIRPLPKKPREFVKLPVLKKKLPKRISFVKTSVIKRIKIERTSLPFPREPGFRPRTSAPKKEIFGNVKTIGSPTPPLPKFKDWENHGPPIDPPDPKPPIGPRNWPKTIPGNNGLDNGGLDDGSL